MLSDSEIEKRLTEINFTTPNTNRRFDSSLQVNAASVDLRLCTKYFIQNNSYDGIKLDSSDFGASTADIFREINCKPDTLIKVKPGKFILARTYEEFSVPVDCSAVIQARSSYARLGLEINSASQFINPGWRGHMPLVIYNRSKTTIALKPYDRIAQVSFQPLQGKVSKPYIEQTPTPKYHLDTGGPSKIWIDLCKQGFEENGFQMSMHDSELVVEIGKKLNQATLKRFLTKLPSYSKTETSKEIVEKYLYDHKYSRIFSFVLFPMATSIVLWGILLALKIKGNEGIIIPIGVGFSLLLTHLYWAKFDSIEKINGFWNSIKK